MTSFHNLFLIDKAGLLRLAILTLATAFMSAFMLPLTLKTQMPVTQAYTQESFAEDARTILTDLHNDLVVAKGYTRKNGKFVEAKEPYLVRLRDKAQHLAEQAAAAALATERDRARLFKVRIGFAAILAAVYLLAIVLKRPRASIEYAVPLITSGMIMWKSLESGTTTAMLLAILIAGLGFIAKMISDTRRTEVTWPRCGKAAVAFAGALPLVMAPLIVLYFIGDSIDAYITRGILSTEKTLVAAADDARTVFDDFTKPRSAWFDPIEWLVWRPLRRTARWIGTPAIAHTVMGIRLTYSFLRALFEVLHVASRISFVWLVIRAFAFVACRSVLFGGGGFVFRLPPPSDEASRPGPEEYSV
jgi:hypothetical protein